MTDVVDPYGEYKEDAPESDKLDMLTNLAQGWKDATDDVANAAVVLAAAQLVVRDIEENRIPEIMDDLELETFTAHGLKVAVTEIVRCSIPKAKESGAFKWLRENGHAALIKRKIANMRSVGRFSLVLR